MRQSARVLLGALVLLGPAPTLLAVASDDACEIQTTRVVYASTIWFHHQNQYGDCVFKAWVLDRVTSFCAAVVPDPGGILYNSEAAYTVRQVYNGGGGGESDPSLRT